MDSERLPSTSCLSTERKRIYFYYFLYSKGLVLPVCLPFIILLFTGLSTVLIFNVIALKTELENLEAELKSFRKSDAMLAPTLVMDNNSNGASSHFSWGENKAGQSLDIHEDQDAESLLKGRSRRYAAEGKVYNSCLQLIADQTKDTEVEGDATIIPWLLSVKQGSAFEEKQNKILIKENGLFFIYGQVWYQDKVFAMGHVIQRKKMHTVGNDPSLVTLFTCIQNMPQSHPNNSCFTSGIAKLDEGDELLLTVPRGNVKLKLSGDGTFFGAFKLS
ncbi:tumor necrosis factor ligand superfamily member 13B [Gastrophryne carolinensis]